MNHKNDMLSERKQTEKNILYDSIYMNIKKKRQI